MKRGEITDFIPTDLINEIFLRLPAKSIARFHCVSKLWCSMLCRPYFTELFLTAVSSARPRLLFGVHVSSFPHDDEWLFFSSPQPQNPYEKSSLVVATKFHIKISREVSSRYSFSYASSLLYFQAMDISKDNEDTMPMICNPTTGQYEILPKLSNYKDRKSFLGYDPIDKQFKILSMAYPYCFDCHKILTLGTGKMVWRFVHCPLTHDPINRCEGICINGVLYYLAQPTIERSCYEGPFVIVCFDVRSEKFKFLEARFCRSLPLDHILINYKGKLGWIINLKYASDGGFPLKLCMWVLEDIEKPRWFKKVYTLLDDDSNFVKVDRDLSVVGMTANGEIVLSNKRTSSKPIYVFYFNLERKTLRSVEIKGFGKYLEELEISGAVFAFVDHVEDHINVNNTKELMSNPLDNDNGQTSIIRKRRKPKRRLAPSVKKKKLNLK